MDDLREKDVETVLPSTSNWNSQNVMVLKGEFKGELAKILEKDKKKEKVTVQMTEEAGMQIISIRMDVYHKKLVDLGS